MTLCLFFFIVLIKNDTVSAVRHLIQLPRSVSLITLPVCFLEVKTMQSSEINAAAWVKAVSLSDPQILHLCV